MQATSRKVERDAQALPPEKNFRFFDNRQKYLMFVNTCSEKWVVAGRVNLELASIHPRPPAVRLFDAGVGDGTVLSRVMRAMHKRFTWMPHYIVAKEISLEDIRLTLEKMPDRFFEHPATVLVLTNLYYAEAPWLTPHSVNAATSMVWKEVALRGSTSADFEEQVTELQPFLARDWRARISPKSGNPVYEKPVVLILYREDQRFLLDSVIPRRGATLADFDLVIASQPYRARASTEFKAKRVIAPLARALRPGPMSSRARPAGAICSRRRGRNWDVKRAATISTLIRMRGQSSATTCTRFPMRYRKCPRRSARRPFSPPGTTPLMSRRSRIRGSRRQCEGASISMPPARSCSVIRRCGSTTNPM
jgi:hypothetical protein